MSDKTYIEICEAITEAHDNMMEAHVVSYPTTYYDSLCRTHANRLARFVEAIAEDYALLATEIFGVTGGHATEKRIRELWNQSK